MKRLFLTVAVLICISPQVFGDIKSVSSIDRIKAVVNGEIITQGDIDLFLLAGQPGVDKARMESYALQRLIERTLIKQKARELGITISEKQLDAEVDAAITAYPDVSRKILRKWIEQDRLLALVQRQLIAPKISVAPEEVKKHYELFIDEFREPAKILIRNIAINYNSEMDIEAGIEDIRTTLNEIASLSSSEEEKKKIDEFSKKVLAFKGKKAELIGETVEFLKTLTGSGDKVISTESLKLYEKYRFFKTEAEAQKLCEKIEKELKSKEGKDFETLVIQYSEGPYRKDGGKWDWFAEDQLNNKLKNIEESAFKMSINEISGIIDAGNTKYIIQKIGEKEASRQELSSPEVQEQIIRKIVKRKEKVESEKMINELRQEAYIKIY